MENKIDAKELLERVYDEIMGLAGIDKIHPKFPINRVKNQWVGDVGEDHCIYFEIGRKAYKIHVTETKKLY